MERDEKDRMATPQVHTLDDLEDCLLWLADNGLRVGALFVDYLQRIPSGQRGRDRSDLVHEHTERLKDMAMRFLCPTFVAAQAGRDVDEGSGLLIPGMKSGQWASNIEQTTDKLYGQTRPIMYMDEGREIIMAKAEKMYRVSSGMMVYKVLKQRWADSGRTFMLNMNPAICKLSSMLPDRVGGGVLF